jgi:hypothetical protein
MQKRFGASMFFLQPDEVSPELAERIEYTTVPEVTGFVTPVIFYLFETEDIKYQKQIDSFINKIGVPSETFFIDKKEDFIERVYPRFLESTPSLIVTFGKGPTEPLIGTQNSPTDGTISHLSVYRKHLSTKDKKKIGYYLIPTYSMSKFCEDANLAEMAKMQVLLVRGFAKELSKQ